MKVKQKLKHLLARAGRIMLSEAAEDPRTSATAKAAQSSICLWLQALARAGKSLPRLEDSGFRVFSQFEEDGYLLYLAAVLEISPKIFIDIGAADGIVSNCANLALNLGWHGLFIDGNAESLRRGETFYANHPDTKLYPPLFRQAMVGRENINQVIDSAGFHGAVGIMSVDIDGNDYWIWDALNLVEPVVVVIEAHIEFGMNNIVVPYDSDFVYPGKHPDYFGASPLAMVGLAHRKGYRLVGANRFGFNLIFARKGIFEDRVPEIPLDRVLSHPRYLERLALFNAVRSFPYITPEV